MAHGWHVREDFMNWASRMTDSVIQRQPVLGVKWAYEWGVILKGVQAVWEQTQEQSYLEYIQSCINHYVEPDGNIHTYRLVDYNIDNIHTGKLLFFLKDHIHDQRYEIAIQKLREQMIYQPRTESGGFWHKLIYPHQMWLDGIYMHGSFYAEYAKRYDEHAIFDDLAHQIKLIYQHTLDTKTGLLYHGWDESKQQPWSNKETGQSPHFWGRAMGWFVMALVDIFDFFPADHPDMAALKEIFVDSVDALLKVQHNGLWYQILDQPEREKNYPESSASCMIVYAIAKGVRGGYLPSNYAEFAQVGYHRIVEEFITVDADGLVDLNRICSVGGLGGTPYRDGSYDYYMSEPIVTNDDKGVGAFILASVEMERILNALNA
jgi:unsaturated rhamnogalacturonyl hydrolase